jgi:hypothetical protein
MMAEELDDEDMSNDDEEDEDDEKDKIAQDRSSSPLSCLSDNEDENANDKENGDNVNEIEHAVKAEALEIELAPAPQPRTIVFKSQSRAPSPVKITPPVPEHVDLPALIVSTIVFSGSSKLSLPDLVKHMLEVSYTYREDLQLTSSRNRASTLLLLRRLGTHGSEKRWNQIPCSARYLVLAKYVTPDRPSYRNIADK